jgi:tetratricopeptide (TPR) repeat protein
MGFESERHHKLGKEFYAKGRFGEAIQEFRKAIKISPGFADLYNHLGLAYHLNGEYELAIKTFKHAIKLNPNYVEAHLNLAITLNELGRYEDAVAYFSKASEAEDVKGEMTTGIRNKLSAAHVEQGDAYCDIGYNSEGAEEYQKALKLNPHYHDIRLKLAKTYLNLEQYYMAVEELEAILKGHPDYVEAMLFLGVAHLKNGQKDKARKQWKHCLEKDAGNIRAKTYLALMDRSGEK